MNSPLNSQGHCRRTLAHAFAIVAFFASTVVGFCQNTPASHALAGPFLPGDKGWTTVPGGDFESGPTNLPVNLTYGPLIGDIELFTSVGSSGIARRSSAAAFSGQSGIDVIPGRFNGAGIAVTYYKTFSILPGQTVVLSAFVKRLNPAASKASVALDFWSAPGSISIPVPATTSEWQFVYGTFTAPVTTGGVTIGARLNIDGNVTPADEVYLDELAVTPLAQFVPPRPGGALSGQFIPGTGFWTPLPGGSFEEGPYQLPINGQYGPLTGDMELFASAGTGGAAFRSNSAAYSGARGVDIRPGTFNGAGLALTYYSLYPVSPGTSVVLSAFVRRVNPNSKATVALDFWDIPGTSQIVARTNTPGWQFLYSVFTAPAAGPTVNIGARVTIDGTVTPADEVFVDELSITPLSQFVAPQYAPLDYTLGAEGTASVVNGFVVKVQLTSGGFGYTNVPNVSIVGGGGSGATAVATVSDGIVTDVQIKNAGFGYNQTPIVVIDPPRPNPPEPASATATVVGGRVTSVTLNDTGSGYSRVPAVQILGGGGSGAKAVAVMSNGIIIGVTITNPGSGYTSTPMVIIDPPVFVAAPPFSSAMAVKTVTVTLSMSVGRIYLLESSLDLNSWTAAGDPFTATAPTLSRDFEVAGQRTYFRLRDVTFGQ